MASKSLMRFEFESGGPKGTIKKTIEFKRLSKKANVYNLGFGDEKLNGDIDDLIVTGNNDSQKVLATVAFAVIKFLEKHPDKGIYATGSTKARSRLYKIGISNNLEEIQRSFVIYGYYNDNWQVYEKDMPCEEFLVTLKK